MVSVSDTQGASTARPSRHIDITEITFPYKPGDYVVHAQHGIAHFKELVRRDDRRHGTRLPAAGIRRRRQAVRAGRAARPRHALRRPRGLHARGCTRLNTADWSRAMKQGARGHQEARVRPGGRVRTPSQRARATAFGPDTPAQMRDGGGVPVSGNPRPAGRHRRREGRHAVSAKPMDRLVCGDVGFGKTEVALRAAFTATQDKKQVMVLCPTTILAQQHFTNFKDRFEPFGVTRRGAQRASARPQQQAAALKGFADGERGCAGRHASPAVARCEPA